MDQKSAYICGPLTELSAEEQEGVKALYETIADVFEEMTGVRAFVPHEHYDPIKHAHYTPQEVDAAERAQVCTQTSLLVVIAIAPSWGGGIEVEMANQNGVPVVILYPFGKKISRLLKGNPAVVEIISYCHREDAIEKFRTLLPKLLCVAA